ncbi:serine/threonine protein kinase [Azoarcus sp. KH32C]|uniref:serine/threonine protein kinase n=1 Tax=Azoarcus sp. KH32C TaxID=748247 RepID=UPI0002387009|nr:serine/threonine protein kinase [Azoarcus sp. KH32C]BAL24484.1 serine/threonine protein kinase [Azoarcus sp. KH32C]
MASLSHAIHAFHAGGLSPNEFFAQVDRALASEKTDYTQLLEVLSEEHTKFPLPADVYAEVHRRIENLAEPQPGPAKLDQTRMLVTPEPHLAVESDSGHTLPDSDPERLKGVGETIKGRFRLEECVGFGGMGTVYKALDLRKLEASDRNPYIAIKILNVQFRGHPKSLIALQREAKKAQTLAHPNIVTVYDFDRDGPMVFLTMEYLCGKPLSRLLHSQDFKGLRYPDALKIITGMANALAYAHERGFVHCDFKPANVFLTDSGQVKIIDFGIARVFRKSEEETEATVFDAGSLGGLTPAYASPEILEHREPDPRDDIYALACITYELLTGTHPFGRVPATQARDAGLKPQRPKNLPSMQWRALRSGLSFDRQSRTPTVTEFLRGMRGERSVGMPVAMGMASLITIALAAALFAYLRESPESPVSPATPEKPATAPAASTPKEEGPAPAATAPAPAPAAPPPVPTLSLSGVTPVLAQVPCSALTASVSEHTLQVQGFLPERVGAARLKKDLSAIPGVTTLNAELQEVSDDKCGVIEALAPYWVRNRQSGRLASIRMHATGGVLTEGDSLVADITTPGYESYVYVDYQVLDGSVVHLVPSSRSKANQAPPNYTATIGTLAGWTISKPFGTEMIVLLITPVPLFDGLRPASESRPDYLRAVDQRLRDIAAKYGQDRISADFVQITTKPRGR